jgi:hypothetical protein
MRQPPHRPQAVTNYRIASGVAGTAAARKVRIVTPVRRLPSEPERVDEFLAGDAVMLGDLLEQLVERSGLDGPVFGTTT